ncbi:MAG: hypothetical protein AB8B59_08610 [Maribacter sp.]
MKNISLICVITFIVSSMNAQSDIKNSKDYEFLPRLPEYHIYRYAEVEYDSHKFFIDGKSQPKEGKKYSISYRHNNWEKDDATYPSKLQILRNYSQAIVKAGGQVIFERSNSEHGYYSFTNGEQKEIWVQIKAGYKGKNYTIYVIEQETMRQDITIDAELIKNKIDIDGKIAIYGIYFDVGKSEIKEESEAAFVQISDYLKENPEVNCWIVGLLVTLTPMVLLK